MTAYFCDSSAPIKRYISEQGSTWVEALVLPSSGNQIFIAQVTPAEIISGIARLQREGALTASAVALVRRSVDLHTGSLYRTISLSTAIVRRAENILLVYLLRAYDAIQLASALDMTDQLAFAGQTTPIFVSADRRLLAAAAAEGLTIADPNQHG